MPMLEVALAFDGHGKTIYEHLPCGRTDCHIPNHKPFFDWLLANVDQVAGVAHLHPFTGLAWPSREDITTFSAIELGLDKRLIWPIVTLTNVAAFTNNSVIGTAGGLANRYTYTRLASHPPFDTHWLLNAAILPENT